MYALGHDIYYYDRYCLIYGYYKCSELKSTTNVESLLDLDSRRYIKIDSLEVGNSEYCQSRDACLVRTSRIMEGARVPILF